MGVYQVWLNVLYKGCTSMDGLGVTIVTFPYFYTPPSMYTTPYKEGVKPAKRNQNGALSRLIVIWHNIGTICHQGTIYKCEA